ncbi:MAG: BLUF domain-containing protein [Oceanicaulis sp.]
MDIHRIIYTSRPFGYDEATLGAILMDARAANARDGVTGALICREDVYMQLLEGPGAAVRATAERIGRDDRHVDMRRHVEARAPTRMFEGWAMLHDPAVSWIWSRKEVAAGAVERATGAEVEAFFLRLRKQHMPDGAM